MREDLKVTKKAYLYTSVKFHLLYKAALREFLNCTKNKQKRVNHNKFLRKHLGFYYSGSYNKSLFGGYLIFIIDQRKFLWFKLKYGL